MKLKELTFEVKKQEDGWYAVANYSGGTIAAEAKDYDGLKEKVKEAAETHFNPSYMKEKGLIEMPKIKLHLEEQLFDKGKGQIVIAGQRISSCNGMIYKAIYNGLFSLNVSASSLETLRDLISEDIAGRGYSKNSIVFSLEENL